MKRSVLIRGSLGYPKRPINYCQQVVDSIRSWHNGEIILSTWEEQKFQAQEIRGLDKIVLSKDPGHDLGATTRQYINYVAGLEHITGDQIMVTRTDIVHFENLFDYIDTKPVKTTSSNLRAFTNRLVIGNMMTIDPNSHERLRTFRPSDWFQVGFKEDIMRWAGINDLMFSFDRVLYTNMYENDLIGTEKLWFCLVLKKYALPEINWSNTNEFDHLSWQALIDNFKVLDTITSAKSINLNWAFQPQHHPSYVTEQQCNIMTQELCV